MRRRRFGSWSAVGLIAAGAVMLAWFAVGANASTGLSLGNLLGNNGAVIAADSGSGSSTSTTVTGSGSGSSTTSTTITGSGSGSSTSTTSTTIAGGSSTTTTSTTSTTIAGGGSTTTSTTLPVCTAQLTATMQGVRPGESVGLNGTCLPANTAFQIVLYSDPVVLGSVTSDAFGNFATTVTIPASTPSGTHTITVTGSNATASVTLLVSGDALGVTGVNLQWAWLGAALMFAGAVLLAGRRLAGQPLF